MDEYVCQIVHSLSTIFLIECCGRFFIDGDDKNSLQLLVGWLGVSEVMDVMDGMRRSTNTTQQSTIYLAVTSDMRKK